MVVTADKIISNRLDEPDEHLNDFAFFEFVTYVTYGSVMFAFIYYHYVFYEIGRSAVKATTLETTNPIEKHNDSK